MRCPRHDPRRLARKPSPDRPGASRERETEKGFFESSDKNTLTRLSAEDHWLSRRDSPPPLARGEGGKGGEALVAPPTTTCPQHYGASLLSSSSSLSPPPPPASSLVLWFYFFIHDRIIYRLEPSRYSRQNIRRKKQRKKKKNTKLCETETLRDAVSHGKVSWHGLITPQGLRINPVCLCVSPPPAVAMPCALYLRP